MATINSVSVTASVTLLYSPGPGSASLSPPSTGVQIINLDIQNTFWVSNSQQVQYGVVGVALGPLASMSFDGSQPIYGVVITGGAAVLVGVVPSGTAYSAGELNITGDVTASISGIVDVSITGANTVDIGNTPTVDIGTVSGSIDIASVAGNVDVVGQGGFISPGAYTLLLNDTSGHSITAPFVYTTGIFDMTTFQSFSLLLSAYNTSQGTTGAALTAQVVLSYYADEDATILIDTEAAWFWLGDSLAAVQALRGSGPLKGAYMTVTVQLNPVSTTSVDITQIVLYGAGRSLTTTVFQQQPPVMTSGYTIFPSINPAIAVNGADGLLVNETDNTLMAVSSVYWWPLPLFNGTISFRMQTAIALASDFVVCSAQALIRGDITPGAGSLGCLWNPASAAGVDYTTTIAVGNCPLYFVVKTTASAGPEISVHAEGIPA